MAISPVSAGDIILASYSNSILTLLQDLTNGHAHEGGIDIQLSHRLALSASTYNPSILNPGHYNLLIGTNIGSSSKSGYDNIVIGDGAANITSGISNTIIGQAAAKQNKTSSGNTVIGTNAMYSGFFDEPGSENTAVGVSSLSALGTLGTIGNQNTAIGKYSGQNLTSGNNNTILGYNAQVPSLTGSNQVRVGNSAVSYAGVQVAWTITSDKRYKKDIKQLELGLDFINELNPVEYKRIDNNRDEKEFGLIAQDLEEVLEKNNIEKVGLLTKDDKGYMSIKYNDLIPCLIKAVQEQSESIKKLENRIKVLEGR